VFFDQKSFAQLDVKLVMGTSLDKATGHFRACIIPDESEASAIFQLEDWLRCGATIEVAYFDRHRSYLSSQRFRAFLATKGIKAEYSKGDDARWISDLETSTAHRAMNT
jgi:hypothetical protein